MQSCLYEGRVLHHRAVPVEHEFEFPLFLVYLDLAELDSVFAGRWLWSTRRPAFARFERGDHLGDPATALDESVRALVEERTGFRPQGSIRLLTHLRYAGYVFNPVSFYYCWDARNEEIEAVVAHVTNTPWQEQHSYVLRAPDQSEKGIRTWTSKDFHVSPFLQMDLEYRWTFEPPGEHLTARIESFEPGGGRVFDAALALERQPICTRSLARALLRHPLVTARATAAIYWQALRLTLKRTPFHPHPEITA